jgi:hypothetical protein
MSDNRYRQPITISIFPTRSITLFIAAKGNSSKRESAFRLNLPIYFALLGGNGNTLNQRRRQNLTTNEHI